MAYQYPSGLDFASGRDAGLAAAYDKERGRALRAGTVGQNISNQSTLNTQYYRELELRGVIKTTVDNKGHAQYTIDKSKFLPAELLEFLQRTTPEITEYSLYDADGKRTGTESMIMEDILGKTDEDGNMKYLISGRRPDGKRSFMDRRRRKGASDDKEDPADITGGVIDMLANTGLARLMSSIEDAKNYSAAAMQANNDPTAGGLTQMREEELARLRQSKVNIGLVQDARASEGDKRKGVLDVIDGILKDPALRASGSPFELIKSVEPYWEALGGDMSDIVTSDSVMQGAAPINTGRHTTKNRPIWEDPDTGEFYSEKTTTFQTDDGKWINMPTVDASGNIIDQTEIEDYVRAQEAAGKQITDPITGEEIPKWNTLKEAEGLAELRSSTLVNGVNAAGSNAEEVEYIKNWFSEQKVTDLDDAMEKLQNEIDDERDLYSMMRLVAGTQEDPTEAMLEMERRLLSPFGFVSDPDALYPSGTAPKAINLNKESTFYDNLEHLSSGILTFDTSEDGRGLSIETESNLGTTEYTSIAQMVAQNRGLQSEIRDGKFDSDPAAKQQALDKTFDSARDIVALMAQQHGKRSWRDRVAFFGIGKGERWMSDARRDFRLINGNPDLPLSTLTAHRDNLRLVVGEDSIIQTGMLGRAHQMPRIYIQNATGQETRASAPLSQVLGMFNSVKEFETWLEASFSTEEFQNFQRWRAEGFLDAYTKGAGLYAPGRSIRSPMKEEELEAINKGTTAIQRGMMRP